MIIPDAWLDESDEIEVAMMHQRLHDIAALLLAFKKTGDERLLELAITMTGEYDE